MATTTPTRNIMENTDIQWTENTFNPWIGCTKVSPGCLNCYAETLMDKRFHKVEWGKGKPRVRSSQNTLDLPLKWQRQAKKQGVRTKVFCASLADWLDDEVPLDWLRDLLVTIDKTPDLDWQLLTKRPENWLPRMKRVCSYVWCDGDRDLADIGSKIDKWLDGGILWQNIWFGTSAEDQTRWDERIPIIAEIPATIKFISAEPLLADIHMSNSNFLPDWVIVGGESGPGPRPMKREWVEHIRNQCVENRIAFFFKQWGGVKKSTTGRLFDGKTWDEFPILKPHCDSGLIQTTFL